MTRPTFLTVCLAGLMSLPAAVAGEAGTVTISDTPAEDVVTVATFLSGGPCDAACGDFGCDACGSCKSMPGFPFGNLGAHGFGDPYRNYGYVGPLAALNGLGAYGCRTCPPGLGLQGAYGAYGGGPFGFLSSKGCCGYGCGPAGKYGLVYAVDPNYTDPRDGRPYAAEGTGLPMSVPLAPTVRHTYNYGWGVPSSRVTPIYRHAVAGAAARGGYVVPGSERVIDPAE
ncbi:MAG: hypothetical protein AAF907_09650 [Planctomycetota bacterium]